jgi:8-oxo-dGTP pyrophosphatase MutT (NUDIX family)
MSEGLSVQQIAQAFDNYPADKKWYRALSLRAAVAIILDDRPDLGLSFLMIQRAVHEGDPWSGQMAFPGGKAENDDDHITATAMRESFEELNIASSQIERIGRLSDILARPYRPRQKPMVVSPLVFRQCEALDINSNHEVADTIWLPVSHFQDVANRKAMDIERFGQQLTLPCYYYQDKKVWGLSLLMIDELLRFLDGAFDDQ